MNQGFLSISVWPTYMGVACGDPGDGPVPNHEPWDEYGYERGQIHWRNEDDKVLGRAQVWCPKGVYTHLVFCSGCVQPAMMGFRPLEQPIVFDRPGLIEVDPIHNQDVLPRLPV